MMMEPYLLVGETDDEYILVGMDDPQADLKEAREVLFEHEAKEIKQISIDDADETANMGPGSWQHMDRGLMIYHFLKQGRQE